jgi:hypothetical protein
MPQRQKKEPLSQYVQRCLMVRRKEHPDESHEQTVAVCINMGKTWWKAKGKRSGDKK